MGLLESFSPPPGSPEAVRAGASCWREVADGLDRLADGVEQRSRTLSASWGGPAKAAYEGQSGTFLAAIREGTGQLREGADRLDEVAAKIEQAQNRYRQAMVAAGITLGVGIALTAFTFGGSDAAAVAVVSAEVGAAVEISAVAAAEAASVLSMLGSLAVQLAGRFAIFTVTGIAADGAAGMVVYKDGNPFAHLHLAEDVELGLVGAVGAPIGGVMTAGATRVAGGALLRGGAGVATGAVIDGLSLSSADAIVRGLLGQEVDVTELGVTALTGAAGSAAARGGTAALNRPRPEPLLERPPDVGLSDRGLLPDLSTRRMTRQQWRAEQSRVRAERTTAAVDQPLENPDPKAADHGHGHAWHGWQTTSEQQRTRVETGVAPDGTPNQFTGTASRFRSPQAEAEALGRARRQLEADLRRGAVPSYVDPVTGATTYVDPATGRVTRYRVVVSTNDPRGFADSALVARRVGGPTSAMVVDASGRRVADIVEAVRMRARVSFEYVPSTGEWRPVTYFPEG